MSSEPVFHATVLSNFARGFDKYARLYSKARIPESTYPGEFYVLRRADLAIGVAKARALLDRLALPGDTLIALRASLPATQLAPNARNGLGLVWPSPAIPLDAVHELSTDGAIGAAISVEDAMARSLRIHEAAFAPYDALRPRSISFLPIARGCQAACPFCFSEASVSADQRQGRFDAAAVERWSDAAASRGAERAVITGGGEPTLLRWPDLLALVRACRARFPKVVLITNGVALIQDAADRLRELHAAGLSVLAISRHHPDEAHNARIMNLPNHTPVIAAARAAAELARLRLVCVLQRGAVDSVAAIDDYVRWAAAIGADEVCFEELYVSTSYESVFHSHAANAWSASHQVPLVHVVDWANRAGFDEIARLPWGAPVFRGERGTRPVRVAAYTEPSLYWERASGIARSRNVMADRARAADRRARGADRPAARCLSGPRADRHARRRRDAPVPDVSRARSRARLGLRRAQRRVAVPAQAARPRVDCRRARRGDALAHRSCWSPARARRRLLVRPVARAQPARADRDRPADCNAGFIAAARRKLPTREFIVGDMATFRSARRADVTCCLGTTLSYNLTSDAIATTLANLRRHTRPGGRVVIDVLNAGVVLQRFQPRTRHAFIHDGRRFVATITHQLELATQTITEQVTWRVVRTVRRDRVERLRLFLPPGARPPGRRRRLPRRRAP